MRGECNEAAGKKKGIEGCSSIRETPRNWGFQSLHISANCAELSRSWKRVRRRATYLTWTSLRAYQLPIWAVKMEIPIYTPMGLAAEKAQMTQGGYL